MIALEHGEGARMMRGPVALFGAIVAVGLGPALWLGVQFGRFDAGPAGSPGTVKQQHSDAAQLMGGTGAGENETGDDNNTPVRTRPRAHVIPLTTRTSASPSASAHPSASATPSDDPSGSGPSGNQSASPSESTDPSDGNGDHSQPPSPPTDGSGTASPGGTGTGGSGGGGTGGSGGGTRTGGSSGGSGGSSSGGSSNGGESAAA